jgi:NADP-reducing hydrogenase subunit HndD
MIDITINGKTHSVEEDQTILQVAKQVGILIPHLCYLENVHDCGSCRLCIVEVEGRPNFQASCMTKAISGMNIKTNTEELRHARKLIYELILSDHNKDCLSCTRNQSCELQAMGEVLDLTTQRFEGERSKTIVESSNPSIERDMSKCILCRRCVTMCNDIQSVGILNPQNRGFTTVIGPAEGFELMDVNCTYCGQCTTVCPVGALKEKDAIKDVWAAIQDPSKRVVVQTAPAVRAALGEEFGYEAGTLVTGKMASALRLLGFDDVFDTNFAADLTIIEEGHELLDRVGKALSGAETTLPMITSCSPGWIKYAEHSFPEQLANLSSCKSPHMMLGALTKSYYAQKIEVLPESFYVVSVMPCTAKKYEVSRQEMVNDVDAVLTTRELARMIKTAGIDFRGLADSEFDNPLGLSSGAADIFASTGGVMEAAIRTVYEVVTGDELPFENLHVRP